MQKHWDQPKRAHAARSPVLSACDAWGEKGQGFLASHRLCSIRQLLVYGSQSRPFLQPIPAARQAFQGHDCILPLLCRWTGNTSLCLPGGIAVAASPFELNNRSDVNCNLDIKIAGTCFGHAGQGWAGVLLLPVPAPGLAWARAVWWGFLRLLQVEQHRPRGGAWTTPWQGCWLDSCKINKTPVLCHPLIESIFCLLSRAVFCLTSVFFLCF